MPRPLTRTAIFWWLACAAWCALVVWLSVTASPPKVRLPLLGWDKVQHVMAYALLTLLAGKSIRYLLPNLRRPWWLAAVFALLFGVAMEYLQYIMGRGRMADPGDVVADALGIAFVCLGAMLANRRPTAGEPRA